MEELKTFGVELKAINTTNKNAPMFILKILMIYHSGANLGMVASISPIISLFAMIKTGLTVRNQQCRDSSTITGLKLSQLYVFVFMILMYNFAFESEDTRPWWAKKFHVVKTTEMQAWLETIKK